MNYLVQENSVFFIRRHLQLLHHQIAFLDKTSDSIEKYFFVIPIRIVISGYLPFCWIVNKHQGVSWTEIRRSIDWSIFAADELFMNRDILLVYLLIKYLY